MERGTPDNSGNARSLFRRRHGSRLLHSSDRQSQGQVDSGQHRDRSRTKHDGKWVEERLDKVFAQSLFLYGENILQITMATTTLKDDTRTEPELMDDAKKRLDLALEGLELLPQR